MDTCDRRNRPVVLRTATAQQSPRRWWPRPRTVLGMSAAALLTAAGVIAGSWSVWSVVGPPAPSGNPAPPLWFSPPALEITGTSLSTLDSTTSAPPGEHGAVEDPHQTGSAPTTEDHSGPGPPSTEDHSGPAATSTSERSGRGGSGGGGEEEHGGSPSRGGHG